MPGRLLESLPDSVVASLQVRDAWRRQMAAASAGLEFLVSDVLRWTAGSTVRVAFLDGDDALHADVAEATEQITDIANLMLDFGVDGSGRHRRWTVQDTSTERRSASASTSTASGRRSARTAPTRPLAGPRTRPAAGRVSGA